MLAEPLNSIPKLFRGSTPLAKLEWQLPLHLPGAQMAGPGPYEFVDLARSNKTPF